MNFLLSFVHFEGHMKKIILFIFLIVSFPLLAQRQMNIGFGGGIDYGGLGARYTLQPLAMPVHVFAALGYNLAGAGYQLGIQYHFNPQKRNEFYAVAMYGYNAVLRVKSIYEKNDATYYGPSFGIGFQHGFASEKSFLNIELLLPVRPAVYQTAIDDLNRLGYNVTEPFPIGFSIGYHIRIQPHETD